MMREALALLLGLEDDLEVVATVGRAGEVVATARAVDAEVAVLDIEFPDGSGLDVATQLRTQLPECAVLIVTTFGRPGYLRRAMEAGARAFLVKDGPVDELARAIRRVLAGEGETVVDPALAAAALRAGQSPLTARERDVLVQAAGGAPIAEIATTLYLSPSTVRNYLSSAIGKTGGRNRAEAVRTARSNGWL
jgi:two-component system response regulator DesR